MPRGGSCARREAWYSSAQGLKSTMALDDYVESHTHSNPDASTISEVIDRSLTQSGESLVQLSGALPVMLVFLRHAGCSFCREALGDIAGSRLAIEQSGVRIVLVHMGDTEALRSLLDRHGLARLDRICDPSQELYRAFGLKQGTFQQLFGLKVLLRGFLGGVLVRCGLGRVVDDSRQMPGVFLIDKSAIIRRFRHRTAADRPDYIKFCLPDSLPVRSQP
ncbi:MAG: SelL-related redox protein [Acidobacteriota bacterium]|nr:SelL-related redox protein [Acidobacteriota bacterium]